MPFAFTTNGHHVVRAVLRGDESKRVMCTSDDVAFAATQVTAPRRTRNLDFVLSLPRHELAFHGPSGIDGVLEMLVKPVGLTNGKTWWQSTGTFIELGSGDGMGAVCTLFRDDLGWDGVMVDGDHAGAAEAPVVRKWLTPDNVVRVLSKASAPQVPDVMVIDLDLATFAVWHALLASGQYQASYVVVAVNSYYPADSVTVGYEASARWDGSTYFGMSPRAAQTLASKHGYTLVYCESHGMFCVFARSSILQALDSTNARILAARPGGLMSVDVLQRQPNWFGSGTGAAHATSREWQAVQ